MIGCNKLVIAGDDSCIDLRQSIPPRKKVDPFLKVTSVIRNTWMAIEFQSGDKMGSWYLTNNFKPQINLTWLRTMQLPDETNNKFIPQNMKNMTHKK